MLYISSYTVDKIPGDKNIKVSVGGYVNCGTVLGQLFSCFSTVANCGTWNIANAFLRVSRIR